MTAFSPTPIRVISAHDKHISADFLAVLDPTAKEFTFQFFGYGADAYDEVVHGPFAASPWVRS